VRHENTIVYRKSLELMATTGEAIDELPKGPVTSPQSFLGDQLRKSTSSVCPNFAEGYDYSSRAQQRRYFGYAIQSARESSASFDTARSFRVCREETIMRGKALALDIVKMRSL
jgi:four helix bundle protein